MRAYFWGNMYLSSIQQGIQALHCTSEMFMRYHSGGGAIQNCRADLYNWAAHYKTVVLLNGGDTYALETIAAVFNAHDHPYAHAYFNEGRPDLNDAMTCVGIVLPEKVYKVADELRKTPFSKRNQFLRNKYLTEFEEYVVNLITEKGLAR